MSNYSQQSSKIIEIVGNRSILCRPASKPIENEGGEGRGGKIVDWKSFQDPVFKGESFGWRADRYREKHGKRAREIFSIEERREGNRIASRDPIDPRPLPPQLYLIKNDRGGSAPSFHSSLFLLPSLSHLRSATSPRGTLPYSREPRLLRLYFASD